MPNLKRKDIIETLIEAEKSIELHCHQVQTFLYGPRHVVRDCMKKDNQVIFEVLETDEFGYHECCNVTEDFVEKYRKGILVDYLKANGFDLKVTKNV